MSTPNEPQEPFNDGNAGDNAGGLPKYGQTSHPEDQPGFAYSQPEYASFEQPVTQSTVGAVPAGKPSVGAAISWAFKAVFSNAKLWVVGSLLILGISVLASALDAVVMGLGGPQIFNTLSSVAIFLACPFIYRMALRQVDGEQPRWSQWKDDVAYWPTLGVSFVVGIISVVLAVIAALPFMGGIFAAISSSIEPGSATEGEFALILIGASLGAVALVGLGSLLVAPFLISAAFWLWIKR